MWMPTPSQTPPGLLSPLTLAFVGDGVYELLVREHVVSAGSRPPGQLHHLAVCLVCAAAQAQAYETLLPLLTSEEQDILRRGRNANATALPRHASPADYRRATALEALFGYLYLSGRIQRLEELFEAILAGAQA